MKYFSLFIFYSIFFTGLLQAQSNGLVRGFIYEASTGEPVMFATVYLEGTTKAVASDIEGFYTLPDIAPGDYRLVATYLGFDSASVNITVGNGEIVYQDLLMHEVEGIDLQAVDVSAERTEVKTETQVSTIRVTTRQIRALPSTGGEADIAQYLQVLPGVIFTGDQGGQLYIRGGSPIQNKVLLDGMTIYNPFHSIGFFSVFETETIRNVDVMTGGFSAEYGGRISSIVNINTRDGSRTRHGGLVSVNPFQAKVLAEGPISKFEQGKSFSSSYLVTAKHSYLDYTSPLLYKYADENGLPYRYTDVYGKVSMISNTGTRGSLFGFNYRDRVSYEGIADLGWSTYGVGGNLKLVPAAARMLVDTRFAFSDYSIDLQEGDGQPRSSSINGFNIGIDFSIFGANSEIKYGFEINGYRTNFRFFNQRGYFFEQTTNSTEIAGFLKTKYVLMNERIVLEPSVRLQYYASLNTPVLEPRFSTKINILDNFRFKFAGGYFSQNLVSTVNERDVVNLFVGFLSAPEQQLQNPERTDRAPNRLQTAWHAIAGVEIDLMPGLSLNIEPYYKRFTQLINLNRSKLEPSDPDFLTETGNAMGLDFLLQYNRKDLFVWAVYSLGYVDRYDGEQIYPTLFDRRHNANLVVSYGFGENWEVGARWNFGSGFPFTLTQAFYQQYQFGGIDTDYISQNGDLGIIYDETRNAGRLPYYHRLDLSIKKTIEFSRYSSLELNFSLSNAYNRANIFYFDRVAYERVDQLPILPSLGGTYKF